MQPGWYETPQGQLPWPLRKGKPWVEKEHLRRPWRREMGW